MFKKILVANRGEIGLPIQRACLELGVKAVMLYSEADKEAKYVKLAEEAVCIGEHHEENELDPLIREFRVLQLPGRRFVRRGAARRKEK